MVVLAEFGWIVTESWLRNASPAGHARRHARGWLTPMNAKRRNDDQGSFETAFVAMTYVLGRRGDQLSAPLVGPKPTTRGLVSALARPDRAQRAQVLAAELGHIAHDLAQRRLV
jgi:hypothetical protein